MKQLFTAIFLLSLLTLPLLAQGNKPSFSLFDKRVKEERAGFAGDKGALSTVFNTDRIRLGDKFETQLLIYIENDVEKHYWISSFLRHPSYLHGNRPLPHLALLLKHQALSLLRGKTDQESLGYVVRLSVTAAVLSEELGLRVLAEVHKKEAEKILASDSEFSTYFPGMDDYDRCLYGSIGTGRRVPCRRNDVAVNRHRLRCPVSGGVLNAKAVSKPAPVYPDKAKALSVSGVVTVPILVDEQGNFDSLPPGVKGHPLLREAAINAASQARFLPTRLSGEPVKVCGVLTYIFELKN
jgi:TonB family protein